MRSNNQRELLVPHHRLDFRLVPLLGLQNHPGSDFAQVATSTSKQMYPFCNLLSWDPSDLSNNRGKKIRAILWENLILHVPKLCSLFDRFQNCFCFSSMAFPSNVGTFSQRLLVLHACKQTKQIHLCWLWSSQKQPESQIQAEVVPKPKQAVDVGHRAAKILVNLQTNLRFLDSTLWSSTWPSRLHVGPVAVLRYNYLLTNTEQFCYFEEEISS